MDVETKERWTQEDSKGFLVVLCGPPGSGKTSLRKELVKRHDWLVVCPDDIRKELYGDAACQGNPAKVFSLVHTRLRKLLPWTGVVYDATNCRREWRKEILTATDGYSAKAVCIWLDTPLEVCLARNAKRERVVPEDVVRRMWEELHTDIPSKAEGFDLVVRWDDLRPIRDLNSSLDDVENV